MTVSTFILIKCTFDEGIFQAFLSFLFCLVRADRSVGPSILTPNPALSFVAIRDSYCPVHSGKKTPASIWSLTNCSFFLVVTAHEVRLSVNGSSCAWYRLLSNHLEPSTSLIVVGGCSPSAVDWYHVRGPSFAANKPNRNVVA